MRGMLAGLFLLAACGTTSHGQDTGQICALQGESCGALPCCRGDCVSGTCACLSRGATCQTNADCCGGFCSSAHICGCARSPQSPCNTDTDCCGPMVCVSGFCRST